jgi:hypothetical protein
VIIISSGFISGISHSHKHPLYQRGKMKVYEIIILNKIARKNRLRQYRIGTVTDLCYTMNLYIRFKLTKLGLIGSVNKIDLPGLCMFTVNVHRVTTGETTGTEIPLPDPNRLHQRF